MGKFHCRVCSANFANSSQRKEHEANEHAPQIHPCNVCDKSFVGVSLLNKHKRLQHSSGDESAASQRRKAKLSATRVDGKHVCHLCGKIYAHGNGLRLHIRTLHQGEQSYSCGSCPKRFGRPDSLVKHRRVHTRQQNFICEFCPRAFSQSSNLIKHRSIQHVDQEEWTRNLCAIFYLYLRNFTPCCLLILLDRFSSKLVSWFSVGISDSLTRINKNVAKIAMH